MNCLYCLYISKNKLKITNVPEFNIQEISISVTSQHSQPNDYNIRLDVFDGSYWKPGSLYRHHS